MAKSETSKNKKLNRLAKEGIKIRESENILRKNENVTKNEEQFFTVLLHATNWIPMSYEPCNKVTKKMRSKLFKKTKDGKYAIV